METLQLDLFATGIKCSHCHQDPGRNPRNEILWNGFLDKDTGEYACWSCYQVHYTKKKQGDRKGLYSEFPVMVK